jgi:ribulose-phosphate 3-epimerase
MPSIYPSLISADLLNLQATMERLQAVSAGWHIDIMDNHFVPNLTWGAQFANAIAQATLKPIWAHLMIDHPTLFLEKLKLAPESTVTFHIETNDDVQVVIRAIRAKNWRPSIAINPKTPLNEIYPYLALVDQVLVMSVNPGHSGQQFIPETTTRVATLAQFIERNGYNVTIACDGGINRSTIAGPLHAGATEFGVAQGIFGAADPVAEIRYLSDME